MKRKISAVLLLAILCELLSISALAAYTYDDYLKISEGTYVFQSALNADKVLDVENNDTQSGTNVQIYDMNGTSAQSFRVKKFNSEWFTIEGTSSGKVLDVSDGRAASKVNVQIWEYNGTDAQLWKFEPVSDGYYQIKNKLGYYLDVCNGKTSNGTNVWVYSKDGTKAQQWRLIQTNDNYRKNGSCIYADEGKNTVAKTNATVYGMIKNPKKLEIKEIGITLSKMTGNSCVYVGKKTETYPSNYRYSKNANLWYNIQDELGLTLEPGTIYQYALHAYVDGKKVSCVNYFMTKGEPGKVNTKSGSKSTGITEVPFISNYDIRDNISGKLDGCFVAGLAMAFQAMELPAAGNTVIDTARTIYKLNGNQEYISSWSKVANAFDVTIKTVTLSNYSATEKKNAVINALDESDGDERVILLTIPVGSGWHMFVVYLNENGELRINDPAMKNGENLSFSQEYYLKKYSSDSDRWGQVYNYRTITKK